MVKHHDQKQLKEVYSDSTMAMKTWWETGREKAEVGFQPHLEQREQGERRQSFPVSEPAAKLLQLKFL